MKKKKKKKLNENFSLLILHSFSSKNREAGSKLLKIRGVKVKLEKERK